MAVRIRLQRHGKKRRPFYRLVAADSRSQRDGRFIEQIGYYDPMTDPANIVIDEEKALKWLRTGAQPSDTAKSLMSKTGVWEKFINEKLGVPIPGPEVAPTLSPEVAPDTETEEPIAAEEEVTGEATADSGLEPTSEGDN